MSLIVLLTIAGLVSLFLEFFLPGMIFAMVGTVLLLGGISIFFLSFCAIWGLFYLFALLILIIGVCKTALWWIKRNKLKDHFYLNNDQEGYVAAQFDESAIGKEGIAFTELKPAGHVLVEGKQLQALCETGFAEQGATIHVVGGKGGHLLVRTKG